MKSENKQGVKADRGGAKRINRSNVTLWRNFSLLAGTVILAIAVISYILLGNAVYSQARQRVEDTAGDVRTVLTDENLSASDKQKAINDMNLTLAADIFIIGGDGEILIPGSFPASERWSDIEGEMNARLEGREQGGDVVYSLRIGDVRTINCAGYIDFDGERCKMLVRYSLNPLVQTVRRMQIYVLIIAGVAIIFTFFISYIVAGKLSQPLRDMSKTAKKLAAGDYSVEFASAQYSEIAELSSALNYMKDEMKKSGDFQKELLANVSHDLKTPLTMIKAYASMVREISGDDPEKRDKHLQVIIDESDRLTGLVDDVLSASKINSGIAQLNKKVFNLTEYLYGVINKFGYLTETRGYSIMVDVDANLYTFADEEKIGQVFYNLISNAVNYTGEDKHVYISLKYSAPDNRIKFSVRDTGKGIPEEELAHIWDRYYRSKDTHTRPIKGTGLGLNIVKAILSAHSFAFGVTSEEGYGSTFYVDFPSVECE